MTQRSLLNALAHAFLSGEPTERAIRARVGHLLGYDWPWLRPVVRRYVTSLAQSSRPSRDQVAHFIRGTPFFQFAWQKFRDHLTVSSWVTPGMGEKLLRWQLPQLPDQRALTRWLAVDDEHLAWFADRKHLGAKTRNPKLAHYTYRLLTKPNGSVRLIESPKSTLKELQRRILRDLLERVPAHPAVHGFVPGRSIKTFAVPHTGKQVVLRMDLKDFFPCIRAARVAAIFRTFGYCEPVASTFAALCTNVVPRRIWKPLPLDQQFEVAMLYASSHLPQGAPTSPALANLCAYRLDCRLSALAKKSRATYTRYADDLAFSGDADFSRRAERFSLHVAAVALEEGFNVNHRKTRIMRRGVRQHLAALTVNQHANVSRRDFDRLKATLTNCVRLGPQSQNRQARPDFRAHLAGRINFVAMINPQKAARLQRLFEQIPWHLPSGSNSGQRP